MQVNKHIQRIVEGFFDKISVQSNKTPIINAHAYKESLKCKLLNGEFISNDEWSFINDCMTGYVDVPDNDTLYGICQKSIRIYGNKVSLNWLSTSNITSLEGLFYGWDKFNGDISKWDTSNVTDVDGMFCFCYEFDGDLSSWDVSNVTNMRGMFDSCHKFNHDLSSWNVSNVTSMCGMFHECESFNHDISMWDVSRVTNMNYMFEDCKVFDQDLSSWDVSAAICINYMFRGCPISDVHKPLFKE